MCEVFELHRMNIFYVKDQRDTYRKMETKHSLLIIELSLYFHLLILDFCDVSMITMTRVNLLLTRSLEKHMF